MLCLGANIKEHRLLKGYTQEQLAFTLGVSSQTISRWETGTTYPDLVMLPIIAELFGTSIDNLIGYAKECPLQERERFFAESRTLDFPQKVQRYREMLQNYPNDTCLQFGLANHLYKIVKKQAKKEVDQEIRSLCNKILHSNIPAMQCGAKRLLALLSARDGQLDEAMQYVNELPSVYCGREILAKQIIQDIPFRQALQDFLSE